MASVYRSYGQFLSWLLAVSAVLLIPGYFVTKNLAGSEAIIGMFWGCGLSLLAAALGGIPQVLSSGSPQQAGALHLGSLAIRMGITLLGVLAILLGTSVPRTSFLLWVAASYMGLLIADVAYVLTHARQAR